MSDMLTEERVKAMIEAAIKQHCDVAFHDGDTHGHKRAHRLMMDDHRAKQKLKEDLLHKIVTSAAWLALIGVCSAIWMAIKNEVNK